MKNKDKALQLTRKMLVVILMAMLYGCLSETHHLGFVSVGQEGWTSTDTISYVVPPLGTCEKHGVALLLLTEGYEYANIALDVTIKQDSVSLYHEQSNFDLVKIAPQAKPPVCKIMDYGKYRFDQAKREKENKKNQKVVEIKEIRLSLNIDTHDFDTKINHARKFIGSGDKVKVSIRFRGREMAHPELGLTIMNRCAEAMADCAAVEKPAKLEGRQMLMFLAPKSSK